MTLFLTTRFLYQTNEWEVCRIEHLEDGGFSVDRIGGPYATEEEARGEMQKFSDAMRQNAITAECV